MRAFVRSVAAAACLAMAAFAPSAMADIPAPTPAPQSPTVQVQRVLVPVIYGETDGNIIDAFEDTGASTVVIRFGQGGLVDGMLRTLEYLRVHPEKHVIVDGKCASACTFLLSERISNACFTARSEFYFHSSAVNGKITPISRKLNAVVLTLFGPALRAALIEYGAFDSEKLTGRRPRPRNPTPTRSARRKTIRFPMPAIRDAGK